MMAEWAVAVGLALGLGIQTSISPCPLATNIAAISFVARRIDDTWRVVLTGLLYTLGRVVAYVGVGALLISGALSRPAVSNFLQEHISKVLGPMLIVTGMVLVELVRITPRGTLVGDKTHARVERAGIWAALPLGLLFALSFCPISAALFIGGLLPLALEHESRVVLPVVFGIGTGLPVIVFAILIAAGAKVVGKAFNRLTQLEWWARRVTGTLFILVGVWYCLRFIFEVI